MILRDGDEEAFASFTAEAIEWAADNGAKVINISSSWLYDSEIIPVLKAAVDYAVNTYDVVIVASSGNHGGNQHAQKDSVGYPAKFSNVLAVGCTDTDDYRWNTTGDAGSAYGVGLDVMAPAGGFNVWSTAVSGTGGYGDYMQNFGQTSAASPQAAGLAALIRSINPNLTRSEVYDIITGQADKVAGMGQSNYHVEYGYGIINAYNAIKRTLETKGGTVAQSITIPSSETWTLSAGITWNFSGNYKLRVDGKLISNGTTSDTIRFTRSGGTWYGIEFYSGTSGSTIQYAKITNAQYGVYNYNTSATVSYSHIENNTTGVYSSNNSSTLAWNRIQSNSYGIQLASYGDANIQTNNVLRYNGYAVQGDATSVPALGNYPGNNSIYSNDYYDVNSGYSGTIYARGEWWGNYPAFPSVTVNVDYSSELSVDPNTWAGKLADPSKGPILPGPLAKRSDRPGDDTGSTELAEVGMKELDEAYRMFLSGNTEQALSAFQAVAEKYPDAFAGARALVFADRILEKSGRDAKGALASTISRSPGSRVGSVAKSLLTGHLVKEGSNQEALNNTLALVDHPDKLIARNAMYDAGNILWYRLNDKPSATTHFRKLIAEYPDDPLSHSALSTLGEPSGKSPNTEPAATIANTDTRLELHNYPNPFNPATVIRFNVPVDGNVSLKVFDLLGREVATLLNEVRVAGSHQVNFDAGGLSSGMYLYRLETGGKAIIQKMMLVR